MAVFLALVTFFTGLCTYKIPDVATATAAVVALLWARDRVVIGCALALLFLIVSGPRELRPLPIVAAATATVVLGFFLPPPRLWCGLRPILLVIIVVWTTFAANRLNEAVRRSSRQRPPMLEPTAR